MTKSFELNQIDSIAKSLVTSVDKKKLLLYGSMGAGKTTLIKAMLKALGAVDIVHSPTYGIVNEYHNADGEVLAYHFDFYRVESLEEALDFGLEDYLASEAYIFMEWPEKVGALLPEDCHKIYLTVVEEDIRIIEF